MWRIKLNKKITMKKNYRNNNQKDSEFVKAIEAFTKYCYPYSWSTTKARTVTELLESVELLDLK